MFGDLPEVERQALTKTALRELYDLGLIKFLKVPLGVTPHEAERRGWYLQDNEVDDALAAEWWRTVPLGSPPHGTQVWLTANN